MRTTLTLFTLLLLGCVTSSAHAGKTNLFILSGQSNMSGLNHQDFFDPIVAELLPGESNITVKDAQVGQPIRRWYKQWKPAVGEGPVADGQLYDRLLVKVRAAMQGQHVDTITFIWMQGERDAREMHGAVYAAAMLGLIEQLRADLNRPDVNVVIGRLSTFSSGNTIYRHWDEVRAAQVQAANADPRSAWIDTDDLERKNDGIHYNRAGYRGLGKRFATQAVTLLLQARRSARASPR